MNLSELGVFVSVCGSVVVSLCFAIQKSKCDKVSVCGGLVRCHRKIPPPQKEETEDINADNNEENNIV